MDTPPRNRRFGPPLFIDFIDFIDLDPFWGGYPPLFIDISDWGVGKTSVKPGREPQKSEKHRGGPVIYRFWGGTPPFLSIFDPFGGYPPLFIDFGPFLGGYPPLFGPPFWTPLFLGDTPPFFGVWCLLCYEI